MEFVSREIMLVLYFWRKWIFFLWFTGWGVLSFVYISGKEAFDKLFSTFGFG